MRLTFAPGGILQIDDARIIFRNFEGRGDKYNREGDRNFAIVIEGGEVLELGAKEPRMVDAIEMAELLQNDVNRFGAAWNVKIRPPRDEDEDTFIYLPVKLRMNERGPNVILKTGARTNHLTEETVGCLDHVDILELDLDIRPYDDEINGKPFRAAYVQGMHVTQKVDRFAERYED